MKKKTKRTSRAAKPLHSTDQKLPFLEHFYELKRRLTYVAVSIAAFSAAAYFVQHHLVAFLLRPAQGQELIYTSPGGGLDFLFRVCIYTGIVFSLPVIIYQFLKYLEPLLGQDSIRFALKGSIISAFLALAGMAFGYFIGLPAALHFLFNQFTTSQINPLIAVQSYMGFVSMYLFGAALLFQVPLVMLLINRIKPLKPRTLFKQERWMVVGAFILAAIMNPTPSVVDQLLLAGPMILMYQFGIGIIWWANRSRYSPKVASLKARDAELQAERQARLADAKKVWKQAESIAQHPGTVIGSLQKTPIKTTVLTAPITDPARQDIPVAPAEPAATIAESTPESYPAAAPEPAPQPVAHRPRQYIDGFNGGRSPARTNY